MDRNPEPTAARSPICPPKRLPRSYSGFKSCSKLNEVTSQQKLPSERAKAIIFKKTGERSSGGERNRVEGAKRPPLERDSPC
ncbi:MULTISPECIES: hypothetical protein [unclassified Paenibacillus]|uniref:hypothetical protein n=1 Tax=unclassified Paenibacillus TaxID=185978 RepID=UPI00115FC960|nr:MULTISPECIES: hypothetical protein [unclassified Paenibacillus]WJM09021.1 hypothetical protein QNO02_03490 [Paenibacillus sp. PK1-4R]